MSEEREQALAKVRGLPLDVRAAIALVVRSAEVQGDYVWNGDDSVYEDDVASTLNQLAREIEE